MKKIRLWILNLTILVGICSMCGACGFTNYKGGESSPPTLTPSAPGVGIPPIRSTPDQSTDGTSGTTSKFDLHRC